MDKVYLVKFFFLGWWWISEIYDCWCWCWRKEEEKKKSGSDRSCVVRGVGRGWGAASFFSNFLILIFLFHFILFFYFFSLFFSFSPFRSFFLLHFPSPPLLSTRFSTEYRWQIQQKTYKNKEVKVNTPSLKKSQISQHFLQTHRQIYPTFI